MSELSKMFRVGQYIAVKVLEHEDRSLMLSAMPQHVNGGKAISDVVRGNFSFLFVIAWLVTKLTNGSVSSIFINPMQISM